MIIRRRTAAPRERVRASRPRRASIAIVLAVAAALTTTTPLMDAPVAKAAAPQASPAKTPAINAQTRGPKVAVPGGCSSSAGTVTCHYYGGSNTLGPMPGAAVSFTLCGGTGGGSAYGAGGCVSGTLPQGLRGILAVNVGACGGCDGVQPDAGWPDGGQGGSGYNPGCGGGGGTQIVVGVTLAAEAPGGGGCGGYGDGASPNSGGGAGGTCTGGGSTTGGTGNNGSGNGGGGGGGGGGWCPGGGGGGGSDYALGPLASSGGGGGGGQGGCMSGCSITSSAGSTGGSGCPCNGSATLSWQQIGSNVALSSSASTASFGQNITLTATVTTPSNLSYTPTGTVTFNGPNGALCSNVALTVGGVAACAVTTPDGGASSLPHGVTFSATYNGDETAATSTGGASVTVVQETTTTAAPTATLTAPGGAPATAWATGDYWALAANTTANNETTPPQTTGQVTFAYTATVGGNVVGSGAACTSTPSASGGNQITASCTNGPPVIAGATYSFTARYAGTVDYAPSTSTAATCTPAGCAVPQAVTTTTITQLAPTSGATSAALTYGATLSVSAQVSGLPSNDTAATVTYENQNGSAFTCAGQPNPATVSSSTSNVGTFPTCTLTPGVADTGVLAVFNTDGYARTSSSSSVALTIMRATSSVSVSAAGAGGQNVVGVPVVVTATVDNTSNTGPGPTGTVAFFKNGTRIVCASSTSLTATGANTNASTATCTLPGRSSSTGSDSFTATFCPAGSTGACTNWVSSTSAAFTYTTGPDPTSTTLALGGKTYTQVSPYSVTAGTAVTLTATVTVTTGTMSPSGTTTFLQNGSAISSCTGLATTASGSTGTVSCTFQPMAGTLNSIVANYNGNAVTGASLSDPAGDPVYILVAGAHTTTTVQVHTANGTDVTGGTVAFGVPLSIVASVVPQPPATGTVSEGTVSFTVDGSPACQNVPVSGGSATCALTGAPHATGAISAGASYGDASSTFLSSNSASVSATVGAASTSTSVSWSPDPAVSGHVLFTATVANSAPGSVAPPAGAVTLSGGAACSSVALLPVPGTATAQAGCSVTPPASGTSVTAVYAPASAAFTASNGSMTYTVSACSATFATLWGNGGTAPALQLGSLGTSVDTSSLTLGATSGACNAATAIPVTSATLSLYGHTVASSSLSGYIIDAEAAGGSPQFCLDGGTLSFPAAWHLPSFTLGSGSTANRLCFAINAATPASVTVGGVSSAQLQAQGITLPFGNPDSALSYDLTLGFAATAPVSSCSADANQLDLTFAPHGPPGSVPFLNATIALGVQGSVASACGSVTLGNLFTGGPITGTFTVSTGTAGAVAGSLTVTALTAAPISLAPGAELYNVSATVASGSGLSISGCAALGNAPALTFPAATCGAALGTSNTAVAVSLSGSYSSGTWKLSLSGATGLTWQPFSTLSFTNLTLTGSITLSAGKVSFDIEAGMEPSGTGLPATPLVAWNPDAGVTVDLSCVALAYGVAATCGSEATLSAVPTNPTLIVDGYVAIGSASVTLDAGLVGTLDLRQGTATLSVDSKTTAASITVVNGLTLTLQSLTLSGVLPHVTVNGVATATIAALGTTQTVIVDNTSGALVIAVSNVDLTPAGIPVTGFFAYASGPVSGFSTGMPALGTNGSVNLSAGFNADANFTFTSGEVAALQSAGVTIPQGGVVAFTASWQPGGTIAFTAALTPPSGFPFLALPDGGSLTSLVVAFTKTGGSDTLTLDVTGTIPVPGQAAANVVMDITLSSDGSFSGTVTVSGFQLFGNTVGFTGTVTRTASGTVTANVQSCQPSGTTCTAGPIAGPFTPFAGVPLQLTNVSFSLGTSGISVSGTATIQGLGNLTVSGSLTDLKNWTLSVVASQAQSWTPAPSVTIDASFAGTVTDTNGVVGFVLSASGANGGNLFTLNTGGVTLTVASVSLGNGAPPSSCSVGAAGDLWLALNGSLSLSLGSVNGSVTAAGCYDLTASSLDLSAQVTALDYTSPDGHVHLNGPTVTITESGGKYSVAATIPFSADMPTGGAFSATVTLTFESGGGFVAGVSANLSQWLGSTGDSVYLYYASRPASGFNTGDPAIGSINLGQGLSFVLQMTIPQSVTSALSKWVSIPAGTGLTAIGNINFVAKAFTFKILLNALSNGGITLFSSGGTTLVLDEGYLKIQIGGGATEFGIGLTTTLTLPSPGSVGAPSSVELTGELDVSTQAITLSLSLGNCNDNSAGWVNAFGVSGLTVKCADIQGGVTFEGVPTIGFDGTITALPSNVASVLGYQNGAPITFAFNLDPFLLDISIGTKNSTTPALEPLEAYGQASVLEVYYANLYIAPTQVTVGQTIYPAGLGLGFQASVEGVQISVLADIGLSPPSFDFTGSISQITMSGLTIGPVSLTIHASPTNFDFEFQGSLAIGPGSTSIGPALSVGGSLSATVQIKISTSGIAAFIWGSIGVQLGADIAQSVCYWESVVPYPCDFTWEYTNLSYTLSKTGFAIDKSGITLMADGYSFTFDWNGTVSVSTSSTAAFTSGTSTNTVLVSAVAGPAGTEDGVARTTCATEGETQLSARVERPATAASATPQAGPGGVTVGPSSSGGTSGGWNQLSGMPQAAAFPASVVLKNGEVLVAGGAGSDGSPLVSAAVYNPATGQWTIAAPMNVARVGASAILLSSGDVLVAGGLAAGGSPISSAEIFHPSTDSWSKAPDMPSARGFAGIASLPGGVVLVTGGIGNGHQPLATTLEYSSSGNWSQVASMGTARGLAATVALPDGRVLIAGGMGPRGTLASTEIFDSSTGAWTAAPSMSTPRAMTSGVLLRDGDALVAGDGPDAEFFSPTNGTWTRTQAANAPAGSFPALVALPNGDALAVGGDAAGTVVASAETFSAARNQWAAAGSTAQPAMGAAAAALTNGNVLVAGGASGTLASGTSAHVVPLNAAELYVGASDPRAAAVYEPVSAPGSPLLWIAAGTMGGLAAIGALVVLLVGRRRKRRLAN